MKIIFINGFKFHFDPVTKQVYDPDDHTQYTTWDHLTNNEREQIRNQLHLENRIKYYQEKLTQSQNNERQSKKRSASETGCSY